MKKSKHLFVFTIIAFLLIEFGGCSQNPKTKSAENKSETSGINPVSITMYKNPDCQCCDRWAAYMKKNGYAVKVISSDTLATIKDKYGVPDNLRACHTALIDGYVLEGHVPVESVNKLLNEQPDAKGMAVPGMPSGAPGTKGERSPVDVYFFNGPNQIAYFDKF